jgi:uncharacterized protein YecE (DUF72 family)
MGAGPPLAHPLTGCCGWAGAQARYFAQFAIIEIQSTFYDPPATKVAAKWRALAPPGFVFCIKAWQLITHASTSPTYRRLPHPIVPNDRDLYGSFQDTDSVWQAWQKTAEIAQALQASVVLFQCPASFQPVRANVQNLSRFFHKVGSQPFRLAWEPRGLWPAELVHDLCAEHGLIHCVDPFVNHSVYGDRLYWRLHGRGSYSYVYSDQELRQLNAWLLQRETGQSAYILFNNVAMKEDAGRFTKLLAPRAPGLPPVVRSS